MTCNRYVSHLTIGAAHDVLITNALPSELPLVAMTGFNIHEPMGAITSGDYSQWTIDLLRPGGTTTVVFTARITEQSERSGFYSR